MGVSNQPKLKVYKSLLLFEPLFMSEALEMHWIWNGIKLIITSGTNELDYMLTNDESDLELTKEFEENHWSYIVTALYLSHPLQVIHTIV